MFVSSGLPGVNAPGYVSNAGGYGGIQGFASRGFSPTGYTVAAPSVSQPLTPKITSGIVDGKMTSTSMTAPTGPMGTQKIVTSMGPQGYQSQTYRAEASPKSSREQALEQRVRELESILSMKEKTIQELETALKTGKGYRDIKGNNSRSGRSPGRQGGFRKVSESKPVIRYTASDQDDPIDVRLEEFYNSTGSAIQFRRINRGFYRFGDSIVELDIINHKLMARTEDGWNRGKFGPIEKFLMYYENIEREKAGILPES